MVARPLRLFSIPVGEPFFPTFVGHLLDGGIVPALSRGSDPLVFAETTIFVPTRRAGQALTHALSQAFGRAPILLPRIVPLGDPASLDDRSVLSDEGMRALDGSLAPVVPTLTRSLVLMHLIEGWRKAIRASLAEPHGEKAILAPNELFEVASSPADAYALAGDLAALMDEMTIEGCDWAKLSTLAADHDRYWDITTDFLKIAAEAWPAILAEHEVADEAGQRKHLLERESNRLRRERPTAPMIVAGSTGSQPTTAELMAAIAALPNGAIVLPGLDQHLSETDYAAIPIEGPQAARGFGSPQAILKRLLERRLYISRSEVLKLRSSPPAGTARAALVSEVLRPADTTELWAVRPALSGSTLQEAMRGITLLEAVDETEEALAIAIRLREVLETPLQTAMLVTPDRLLGQRVAAELNRFGVTIEDSAGRPLAQTPAGRLAALALETIEADFAPLAVLTLLRDRAVRLGFDRAELDRLADWLDVGVVRGVVRLPADLGGLQAIRAAAASLVDASDKQRHRWPRPLLRLTAEIGASPPILLDRLEAALRPLAANLERHDVPIGELAQSHREALAALTRDDRGDEGWGSGRAGEKLADLLDMLEAAGTTGLDLGIVQPSAYPALFEALLGSETVGPEGSGHPRLAIYGPLEARLIEADLVIIGGLNEGHWPPAATTDAFLNRSMRATIGLTPPERRVGQNAHDFAMLMGASSVLLSRAQRSEGQPTIASRYLRRLKAFIGDEHWDRLRDQGSALALLARALDTQRDGPSVEPAGRPRPKPPVALRPASLSITEIETLYRDPYAIFARHVLQLDPLGERAPGPEARDFGTFAHDAIAAYAEREVLLPPEEARERLLNCGRVAFAAFEHDLHARTFWWPRFERIADWYVGFEAERRKRARRSVIEAPGRIELTLEDGSTFLLRGRADRIEALTDDSFAVIDYKTGDPPGLKEVLKGYSPQLTLTAMMVQRGGFPDLGPIAFAGEALYVKLPGITGEARLRAVVPKDEPLDAIIRRHADELRETLSRLRDPDEGYLSRRLPKKTSYEGDYDHLARVAEWEDPASIGEPSNDGDPADADEDAAA